MREWFIASVALSIAFGFVKLILESTGGSRALHTLRAIFGILIISLPLGTIELERITLPELSYEDKSEYYTSLRGETLTEIFILTENELSHKLGEELKARFGKAPLRCTVKVNQETFALSDIQIFYSLGDPLISTYEIKNYIYNAYGVRAEVHFE